MHFRTCAVLRNKGVRNLAARGFRLQLQALKPLSCLFVPQKNKLQRVDKKRVSSFLVCRQERFVVNVMASLSGSVSTYIREKTVFSAHARFELK